MKKTKILAVHAVTFILIASVIVSFFSCGKVKKSRDNSGLYWIEQEGKYGCINTKGDVVISPQFERAYEFSESLAIIRIGGKYGYIDTTGKIAINPQFESAGNFCEGLAPMSIGDKWGYIDKEGKIVINPQFERTGGFQEGLAAIRTGDKWGFINKKGKIVINPQFDEVSHFSEGKAVVVINRAYGYINEDGKVVINPQFDRAGVFSEGLARVKMGDYLGYIDQSGKYAINPQFESAEDFSEGLALVRVGRKYGYIDKKGKYVINPQFERARSFFEGLAAVSLEYRWGYINNKGEWVVKAGFESAGDFVNGIAMVMMDRRRHAYIDKEGNFIWDPREPEMKVKQSGRKIRNGRTFDFDSLVVGENKDEIFIIENDGEKELELSGSPIIKMDGPNSDQFKVLQQPKSPVKPGSNSVFTIRFCPTSEGDKNGIVSILNSDSDENPYIIKFEGRAYSEDTFKLRNTMGDMKTIGNAIESFMVDHGYAPKVSTIDELLDFEITTDTGETRKMSLAPFYIKVLPLKDAWGNKFLYKFDPDNPSHYWIASMGSDGKFEGFDQTGIYESYEEGRDIIFANGYFVYNPRIK